jgi:Tol biopolymer transport system component
MKHKRSLFLVAILAVLISLTGFQDSPQYKILFEKAKFTMETKGDLNRAIDLFNEIIKNYPKEREYAAKSQLYIGLCYEKLGVKEAQKAYRKVVDSYPEQTEAVKLANEKLALLLREEAPAKSTEITIRRIWSGPDANGEGGPSPDGRYLSFTDWEIPALVVHDLATGKNRQLTKKEGNTYGYPDYSIFSPDSKQIAYRWWTRRDICDIRMISLDGSDEHIIYRTKENYPSNFNWSPDGKYILTKLNERPVLISVVDGSIQDLAIENPGRMCISPDGYYVVYDTPQEKNSNQNNICVYDRTTHLTSVLVGHPADDKLLGWSPNGRHVLFSSDRRGSIDAWLIAVSGGQPLGSPVMVRSDVGGLGYGMGFTQVGAYFFSNWGESRDVYVTEFDIQTGKLLSPPEEVAETYLGSNWGPEFSRDGKSLAYVNGQGGIVVQSLKTSEKKQIKPDVEIRRTNRMAGLRWTTDYSSLVGTGVIEQGREGLFLINLSTGETKLFFEPAHPWIQAFDLSPDGKKVFYQGIPAGGSLYIWDSESDQESLILAGAEAWSLAVSPDCKQVAYFRSADLDKPRGLFVVPSTGGTPRLVVKAEDNRGAIAWSPDGRILVYAIPSKCSAGSTPAKIRYQFWSVDSNGGEPQKLDLTVDGMIMSLRIHPDGQRMIYQILRGRSEIWVMENFIPK